MIKRKNKEKTMYGKFSKAIIFLTALSLVLTACGGGQQSTPEPIYEGEPFAAGKITWTTNGPAIVGDFDENSIATLEVDGFVVLAKVKLGWIGNVGGETSSSLDLDVELVDPSNGDLLSYLNCWKDGDRLDNPGTKKLETVFVTTKVTFKCDLPKGISLIGTFTIPVLSVLFQTLVPESTETPTSTPIPSRTPRPTFTINPTATANVPPLEFLSYGITRTVGTDSNGGQVSWIFWDFGQTGYVVSSSATKVGIGFGDAGLTPTRYLKPTWAFDKCTFTTGPYKNQEVNPCYIVFLGVDTIKVTVPGLKNQEYVPSQIAGGPVFYQPRPPRPTPTVTFTPIGINPRLSSTPAVNVTKTTALTRYCDGLRIEVQGTFTTLKCSTLGVDWFAAIESTYGTIGLGWHNEVYFIPTVPYDALAELSCNYSASNTRDEVSSDHILPEGIEVEISCTNLDIRITNAP